MQWTCSIASIKNLGSDCDFFGTLDSSSGVLNLPSNVMLPDISYSLVVTVSSLDGRIARKTVTVNPTLVGSVKVSITSTVKYFNIGGKTVLLGLLTSPIGAKSTWSVKDSLGTAVPYTALTTPQKNFLSFDTASQLGYPLSFREGAFVGGSTYLFKLTAYPTDNPLLASYSEIVLTANTQPTGGYVISSPTSGRAVTTQFMISTPGWTSDAGSLPLSYAFSYCLASSAPYLTLAAASVRAYTTSTLPAGLSQLNDSVTLKVKAIDIYQSSATATTTVAVKYDKSVNLTEIATTSLTQAFLTGDINLVYQTVNNVRKRNFLRYFIFVLLCLCFSN